jgi:hypothetical protein
LGTLFRSITTGSLGTYGKNSSVVVGKKKGEGRIGRTHVKADKRESEDLAVGDWAGIGQKVFRMWLTELHF